MSLFTLPYKKQHSDAKHLYGCYDRVFNTADGRIVLNHLLGEVCHLSRTIAVDDEKVLIKNSGRQQVGLDILKILNPNKEQLNDR